MDTKLVLLIRKMLWEDWDPIGVNEFSQASDEYDNYAPAIAELVSTGASEQEMFDQLWALETGYIGLKGDAENTRQFAAKLYAFAQQWAAS
jgi:hypothetical protein